ncbi:hypothetical protein SDRG_11605 [Saprolegnia diclina VS20]|uniref:Uncharacterized protein n=1 Tax=Saprolegnia diclina (strain VS20) TaxID=1156394 RepID=T0QAL1_SAPDV|nr:hypothetical protein SDRG_11605 [Saprolegnia diclina VS20]EQC30545.1 hypothetical protein SDRG_11605 [Saprolegnia diclina VS20]|eukprot:XP_008615871.1 hypothetical protein SDRG_11605 [Saprolegnia diclina VS20]
MMEAAAVADAPYVDDDGDASWGPFVVFPRISIDDCKLWYWEHDLEFPRWSFEPLADDPSFGRLEVFSDCTLLHQHTHRVVTALVLNEMVRTIATVNMHLCLGTTMSMVPSGLGVRGDVLHGGEGEPYSTLVLDVFCKNESLASLRATLARWMDGTSIFMRSRRYVLVLHVRGQPVEEVEFGFDKPVRAGLAVSFPLGLIYKGLTRPPVELLGHEDDLIRLDLMLLRQLIAQPP